MSKPEMPKGFRVFGFVLCNVCVLQCLCVLQKGGSLVAEGDTPPPFKRNN